MWVLQEIHCAKYAEVFCGEYKILWLALQVITPEFYTYLAVAQRDKAAHVSCQELRIVICQCLGKGYLTLPAVLSLCEGSQVSETLLFWLRKARFC